MKPYIKDNKLYLESKVERITESGCWIWLHSLTSEGYGQSWRKPVNENYAHRLTWKTFKGPIPDDMFVCHYCDIKSCCNPAHLFLGSSDDNIQDMINKDRNPKGKLHGMAKLTEEQVKAIRADARTNKNISKEYSISVTHVHRIKKHKSWASL